MIEKPKPKFIDGSSVKNPHQNAPSWVILSITFEVEKLIEQLKAYPYKYIDMTAKESQKGGMYLEINEYGKKPEHMRDCFKNKPQEQSEDLPPSSDVSEVFDDSADGDGLPF